MKYPIGIQSFDQLREDGYVYVDKTDLVYSLVTGGKIYFLGRPRRFGKSLLVSTLEHYFLGHKDLFKGLKIDSLEKEWLEYPVFHIDFNGDDFTIPGILEKKIGRYLSMWEEVYGSHPAWQTIGDRFAYVLQQAHRQTGRRCVVLVDEYDKPILDVLDTDKRVDSGGQEYLLEDWNRQVLRSFYSVFKAADADLQFVLLTGVTKFPQVSVFSGFNQPEDISMSKFYDTLCGITQEELEHYFSEAIAGLAEVYRCNVEEMKQLLKRRYDGYHFSSRLVDVYNPFSILNVFKSMEMKDYWFSTGTPTYLLRLLSHSDKNMDELAGEYYKSNVFMDYKATVEKPLPMIYQSGYLTIKGYDWDFDTFLLDFPNEEVKGGFISLLAANYLETDAEKMDSWLQKIVLSMRRGDPEALRKLMTGFLAGIPYTMRRKEDERERERYFHYTFYLIFNMVSIYTVYTEKEQSEGRVDCIVETDKYVYVFEFKLDGTAGEALAQIEAKGYARPYEADARKLFRIGAVFSSQTGTISDWAVV